MTGASAQRVHVFVTGMVQGVGFRHATFRKATSLGLTGWVRNLDDGRVEAVIEGDREILDTMLAWCRRGPFLSRVESVDAAWESPSGEYGSFDVVF